MSRNDAKLLLAMIMSGKVIEWHLIGRAEGHEKDERDAKRIAEQVLIGTNLDFFGLFGNV